ncbi:butyrate kinase [Ancylomarina sp. 16SWW S1-10-2]|uniref:butyrate kinase n=1 Tax=Ancylomarina sp. 16SWW S1-10-2 TaxID=2499681 RepID=UPI0012AE8A86|nr:butyrate kinase [Ancylomarina sp. 16SWW S1-10-2]MRT92998.1 butyrate kinase [Ancylomarina sp. 16SWW S1-10-2]
MENRRILAINPGSTSTKIAVYQGDKSVFLKNIKHSNEELAQFNSISEQFEFRKDIILKELIEADIRIDLIAAVVGRGGLIKPIESGVYLVDEKLKSDLRIGILGEHASNLGGLIADNIAQSLPNAKAYIADPVVVDEMIDVARISGHPEFERMSIFHALNQKAVSRSFALSVDKNYEELNVIVAHLGGGISVGAHLKGRVIDVNNALDGEGPFSPERSGTLPAGALAKLCFSGNVTLDEVKKMIKGEGGLVAHLGTNDAYEIELKAKDGDAKAKLIQDAMAYQVGKSIGACAAALKGDVDGIILTGGIAHNGDLVNYVKEMVSFIAPVVVYPGEDEMKALAMNGYMVLRGEIEAKIYE